MKHQTPDGKNSFHKGCGIERLYCSTTRSLFLAQGDRRVDFCGATCGTPGNWRTILGLAMKIVLISTYELGRQPFGLVSPAAWLRKRGHDVDCFDLTRQSLDAEAVRSAELIAIYLPMHTATRLACKLIPLLREQSPGAHICCYGLYAPMNAEYLRSLGVGTVLGGEFEGGLVRLAEWLGDRIFPQALKPNVGGD